MASSNSQPTPATAEVHLADQVGVFEFQALLATLSDLYYTALFLEHAAEQPSGVAFPDDWIPTDHERLWIDFLEIGTPNRLRVRGRAKAIATALTIASSLLGLPLQMTQIAINVAQAGQQAGERAAAETEKARAEAEKARAEALKAKAEADKTRAETRLLDIQLEQAATLFADGRISESAYRDKELQLRAVIPSRIPHAQKVVARRKVVVSTPDGGE